MKCPKCKKDYAAGVKAAYKLGLLDGENRLQRAITLLRKTNNHLLNEILYLDKKSPLDVNSVKLPREYILVLIKFINRAGKGKYHKNKLQAMMEEQIGVEHSKQAKLRAELEHMEWER